ncbi:MAG: efflux RND transporter periplasmic adaptor subunit, partial [Thauera sp.]|nr:efflux RND transporter periplasmic adaptor subunit [Thauera sp.]
MNTTPPSRRPTRPNWGRRALLILVPALVAGGWYAWPQVFGKRDPLTAYQFSTVQRGDIEDVVTATGTLQPRDYVDVGAQVSGQLRKIHVEVGDTVNAGDLLAEIDPTVYRARVDASRAQLKNLRAQLKDREAQLALAQIQLRRQRALMAEDATTKESLQTAEASAKSAEAQLEAVRAQIEQIESTLRGDEANLQYARILSPMAGTVVSITARQGQTLNTNQQAPVVMRIADLSTMTVQTQVSEADVSRLKLGMDAYFTTLGGSGKRWQGKLEKIEPTPTVTNNVVLYNALFDVLNPDGLLMTQMT